MLTIFPVKKINKKHEIREGIEIIYAKTPAFVHVNILFRALSFFLTFFSLTSFIEGLKVKNVDVIWRHRHLYFNQLPVHC